MLAPSVRPILPCIASSGRLTTGASRVFVKAMVDAGAEEPTLVGGAK